MDNLRFGLAWPFYNNVIRVTVRYNVPVRETMFIKKMAKKVSDPVYVQLIILHLAGTNHDLEELCKQIDAI